MFSCRRPKSQCSHSPGLKWFLTQISKKHYCRHLNRQTCTPDLFGSCTSTLAGPRLSFLLQSSSFQLQLLNKTPQQNDLSTSCLNHRSPDPIKSNLAPWRPNSRPTAALRHDRAGQGWVQNHRHGEKTENNQTARRYQPGSTTTNVSNCIFNRMTAEQCITKRKKKVESNQVNNKVESNNYCRHVWKMFSHLSVLSFVFSIFPSLFCSIPLIIADSQPSEVGRCWLLDKKSRKQ